MRLAILMALLAALAGDLRAQATEREALLERWEAMDPELRDVFRRRFEEFARMSPEERRAAQERAVALERGVRELRDSLPPDLERRLRALPRDEREELLREFFCERARARGAEVRELLPPDLVRELEQAPPREREGLLREFQEEVRRSAGKRLLETLRSEGDLSPEEAERIEGLEGRERLRATLALRREQIRRRVGELGPPPDLGAETWSAWDALPLEEFFRSWSSRRRSYLGTGPGDPLGGVRQPPPLDPTSPWVHRGELLRRLGDLARPRLEDLLEHADLSPRERRDRVAGRIRERCLEHLGRFPLLPPEELERLSELEDQRFVEELRAHLGRRGDAPWAGAEGSGPPWRERLRALRDRFRDGERPPPRRPGDLR